MGTRTDILKIASRLKDVAARQPSAGLMPIVAELEACAERADRKRLAKKKAVEELLSALPQAPSIVPMPPKANFLSTVVAPRISDPSLRQQLMDYERSIAGLIQQNARPGQSLSAAVGLFRSRWDA
jgi:hypothetical protein